MGYNGLKNRNSHNETAASERGLSASKDSVPTRPPAIKGGDWLTNLDAPTAVEADRKLGSLLNWDHVWYAMPSTAAVAPVPATKTGPLASYSSSSTPAEASISSTVAPIVPPPVSKAQKHISGPLWGLHDDLTCHVGELQSPHMNHINPPASTANELHLQRHPSGGTKLPFVHQLANLQPQNIRHSSLPASSLTPGPRQTNFSLNGLLPSNSHRHVSNPLLTSPSRQRSLNDLFLSAPIPPPIDITRPKSIPISSASRFIPPGVMSLSSVADFNKNGLHVQNLARVPNFYNDDGNIYINNGTGNNNHNKPTHDMMRNKLVSTTEPKFVPMLSITRPDRTGRDLTPFLQQSTHHAVSSLKFSPRYHGMHTENNASMEHLTPEQNCALWLTNLPPDIRERELLACVRNIGRVYATFINGPDGQTHSTSAAKLVFFTPEAARKLLVRCTLVEPMVIRGHRVKIALNRIKYAKNSMENGESRVLIITGHREFVNEASLTLFFQSRFQFQIDEVATLITHKERAVVEYKFGSYRCQAQMGMKALLLDKPAGLEMVEYGLDPCEVGSEMTSFTVAGERIQGRGLLRKE